MKQSYVYILTNKYRTTFYVGVTSNLEKRILQHYRGEGSQFTKKYNLNPNYAFENLLCLQTLSLWMLRYFSLIHHSGAMLLSRKAPWPLRLNPHNDSLIHNSG